LLSELVPLSVAGDEVLSDSFPISVVDDIVYEVKTKLVVKKEEDVVAANDPNEVDAPNAVTVNNLVDAHNLQLTSFDKKAYMVYIKGYMKQLKEYLEKKDPARVPSFQKAATEFLTKKILPRFDDFTFYTGSSMNADGLVLLMFYKDSDPDPYFWVFKDGLIEEKV